MVAAIQVEGYQLSPQQLRLWPLVRSGAARNALVGLMIEGELHVARLRRVVQQAVETHETLRTIYAEHRETSSVIQIVSDAAFEWRTANNLHAWEEERERKIDPSQLPQLRATLVTTAPQTHILILATTLLAADARSLENLASWIATTYNTGELRQPALQYVQYAEWKNENHGSNGLEAAARESASFEMAGAFSESRLLAAWRTLLQRYTGNATGLDLKREFDELNELVGQFSSGAETFVFSQAKRWEGDLTFSIWRREAFIPGSALTLHADESRLEVQYDPARFNRGMIEDVAESLATDRIIGPRAEQRLLSFSRGPELEAKPERIEELFREQVRRNPGASAVVFENQKLTYDELNAASDALAVHLIEQGATTDTPVAICLERSPDLIVAIMAVLKSGAAYVPIDSEPRIERILTDCGARIVVTRETMRAVQPSAPLARLNDPSGLAYIIYTSGSTGAPKGVCVEHRQVTHYVHALVDRHPSLAGCSFASVSTIAADLGNTAIFTALLTGGCLHLISRERATDGAQFADYLAKHEIDAIKIVPSHFLALADSMDLKSVLPKRCVVFGGEPLPPALVTRLEGVTVINHYGPTETTIGTTTREIAGDVSIGRPLPGTQAYVLDDQLQLTPHGLSGELFIGGDGIARGYLGQPALTATRFIPDPFAQRAGQRLYRTGDRVRFNETGDLIFEGRTDRQVKMAGFRIELGEIEAALKSHPAVRDAMVEPDDGNSLTAYAVTTSINAKTLRDHLASRLPAHMIPGSIHTLSQLPLTPNGKLDRAALKQHSRRNITEPSDPIAKEIRRICINLIDNSDVDVNDNLLDLGVSSLKAMQLLARLRAAFNVSLPLSAIFERPTVNGLAALIDDALIHEIAQLSDAEVKQRILDLQSN